MKCYSLLVGARNRRGTPKFSRATEAVLQKITANHFPDGFTILDAAGGWFDPRRRKFQKEQSRQVLVCTAHPARLGPWCAELARALGQEELLVTELGRARRFIFSPPGRHGTGRRSRRTKTA